jgi:hypothetical protein
MVRGLLCSVLVLLTVGSPARARRHEDEDSLPISDRCLGRQRQQTALAAYWTACRKWPKAKITMRQGVRVVEKSWRHDA